MTIYFHYDNKEEIIEELFARMAKDTYRFFHREMYSLRRKDVKLAKMWRAHLQKMMKLMVILYRHWVKDGKMVKINEVAEMQYIAEFLLAMATTFLQFFESAEKQPSKRSIDRGKYHVARLLLPYTAGETKDEFEKFVQA